MIRVSIRSKRFGDTPVLGPLEFAIAPGETVALVGPSGVGKTTLLRIATGLDRDFDGQVERPENLAMVFQEPTLLSWRSVLDNLCLVHRALSRERALAALARVGLAGKDRHFPRQLSLGQQRRLSLARAFAGPPEFLVMDEPFASLDAETADAMMELTEALIAEHRPATLFVTHSMDEARRLATRTLSLRPGPSGATLG